ncbi:MAG: hypothetical protein NXY57DRAFT_981395 [Lentinula lateritia]|uniref:Transcription activator of gluconeogenesis ERT1 n=1 Tax=Lentinula lateritia TaxID=40482 RepID=A0ABQ8VZB6_9AGAR|nr:hypothetical protein EV359DRAFT_61942 [Lentinula novae-zelandiae]KAJ3937414.1 MAG: hypothetical protein NXY57DRAFT_981395 [Lentinula lateritia]KAJ4501727.1 hypothetical protein C8R41DRAFT_862275 [Lentinula lateritia]
MAAVVSDSTDIDTTTMDPSVHYPLLNTHPLTYSTMPMHMYPLTPSSQRTFHAKRRQVKNACTNCQKACKKCDDARPCLRCIKYGIPSECIDSQRKERKKGVKRGPYNKKRDCKGNGSVGNFDAPPHQQEVMPITNGEGPDNPSSSFHPALGLHYVGPATTYTGTTYINQYSLPPPLPPPLVKPPERREEPLPSLHPTSRHIHSQLYAVYPSQLPQGLSGQEYPSPPTSYYQGGPSRSAYHHVGQYPSYAVHVRADPHQQHLMTQPSYPYMAVAYGKPEGETYLEGQGGGK